MNEAVQRKEPLHVPFADRLGPKADEESQQDQGCTPLSCLVQGQGPLTISLSKGFRTLFR
jgi:hypothetical protein